MDDFDPYFHTPTMSGHIRWSINLIILSQVITIINFAITVTILINERKLTIA